nr:hypothetical protein [Tanacetum cinerariifolium]
REPSGSNTEADSKIDDTAMEQSFVDDQDSVQIGKENFPKGNVHKNNNVPTHFFNTKESSGVRRSNR